MRLRGGRLVGWTAVIIAGIAASAPATDYYVAPNGGSDAPGQGLSYEAPFATIDHAISVAMPGDTIYALGGTHNIGEKIDISKSGTAGSPLRLWAYPGEIPVLDFSQQADSSSNRGIEMSSSADWWHVKGLTIQHAGDNGLYTEGDHGIFEQLVLRNNRDSGFQLHGTASHNLILNSDSYGNYDPPKRGEDADGFAVKDPDIGPGNIFVGDRAWGNSDDGWDMFNARSNGVLILNSWAYDNGYDPGGSGTFNGDGNGFKLGRDSGSHVLANVLSFSNPHNGIDSNGNGYIYDQFGNPLEPNGSLVQVYNSTSYNNGLNSGTNFRFDDVDIPHVLRNNISVGPGVVMDSAVVQQLNTWNGLSADEDDFLSTSDTIARGPRNSDGSLPVSDFLRLDPSSGLVGIGTPITFEFAGVTYELPATGGALDLGAYEVILPGDYNNDGVVDAGDYTVWRDSQGSIVLLPNDTTFGTANPFDYDEWTSHFGMTELGSGSFASGGPVPEPAALTLAVIVCSLLAPWDVWLRRPRR